MLLKERALSGFFWSGGSRFIILIIEFTVGVLLARILSPIEFGLVGMIAIFLILSEMIINSGFSQALIRKVECTEDDFSTAFIFNLCTTAFLVFLLVISAQTIADFYSKPELVPLIQVSAIGISINALSFVQRTKLTRDINFKALSIIAMIASISSASIALTMAVHGYGVWSLVFKTLARDFITMLALWSISNWRPSLNWNIKSFKELFGFGSRLLLSGFLGTISNNIVYVILGRYFNVSDVGYYNRAELFKNIPSQNVENIITSVGYPVLAKLQNDPIQFKIIFRQIFLVTAFIVFMLMFGLLGAATSIINILLGDEWSIAGEYLMYLCPVGAIYPLWTINLNVFNIFGRADLYLKMQLVMQVSVVISVLLGVLLGIKWMIVFILISSVISYCIYSFYASVYTKYSLVEQLLDLLPIAIAALFLSLILILINYHSSLSSINTVVIQFLVSIIYVFAYSEIFKNEQYLLLKKLFVEKIKKSVH